MINEDVTKARNPRYTALQRAALLLTREGNACHRLSNGGSYRQREESNQALLEAARDAYNTPLARALALIKMDYETRQNFVKCEANVEVCAAIALISNDEEISKRAIEKLNDRELLLEVAIYAPWPDVRRAAQAKLAAKRDIEKALEAETDEELCYALKKALKKVSH